MTTARAWTSRSSSRRARRSAPRSSSSNSRFFPAESGRRTPALSSTHFSIGDICMNQTTLAQPDAPAFVRPGVLHSSIKVEPLTCAIGAELSGVNLGDAARDDALFAEIKALLLTHKVLFLRDQDITRAEHVGFARRFGELEDHPVAGSGSFLAASNRSASSADTAVAWPRKTN